MKLKYYIIAFLILTLFLLHSCSDDSVGPEPVVDREPGEIISSRLLGTYSPEIISLVLAEVDISFDLKYSVDVLKIVYQTKDYFDNKVQASGALFIAKTEGNRPMISFQHGTVTKRDEVASVSPLNSVEGVVGLITGSLGYVVCVPDYLGYGVSRVFHPYVHADGNTGAVLDFLRAANSYCQLKNIDRNGQLFLAGYSEGGYVTMALHKEIETRYSSEFTLTAVAPMAGPYDLTGTVNYLLQQSEYEWPAYGAFFFTAYDIIYNWDRLSDVFVAPFDAQMLSLFDGTKTFSVINGQLPKKMTDLIKPGFVQNYFQGNEPEISGALRENSLLDWTPVVPIQMVHGDADDAVPYQNALTALDSLTANGATDIRLITITDGTHATSGLPAIIETINWFNSFSGL